MKPRKCGTHEPKSVPGYDCPRMYDAHWLAVSSRKERFLSPIRALSTREHIYGCTICAARYQVSRTWLKEQKAARIIQEIKAEKLEQPTHS